MKGGRWAPPAVVQTSQMDCGPAALTAALRGFQRGADLEALRDVCSTDVDGTSIDVLTELAVALGLRARQVVVPGDHLRSAAADLLPAIVVVDLPGGLLHFVLVWRRVGRWFLVMDPAIGRQWVSWERLRQMLFRHSMEVAAEAWRDYAGTDAFCAPLRERLRQLGASDERVSALLDTATADTSWKSLARLDAAARAAVGLSDVTSSVTPPDDAWMVRAHDDAENDDESERLVMTGAVVMTIDGAQDDVVDDGLAEIVFRPVASARSVLWELVDGGQRARWWVSATAAAVATAAAPLLVFWVEQLVNAGTTGWSSSLVGLVVALTIVAVASLASYHGVLATGRDVELRLRGRLDARLVRLPEQFFRSRPSSDLAERAHAMHRLRDLPLTVAEAGASVARLGACVVGLIVAAPAQWWAALLLGAVSVGTPAAAAPVLAEVDHRSRTLSGAISHVYLDTLVGLFPVRAHQAAAAVNYEHSELLRPWRRTQRSLQHRGAIVVLIAQLLGYAVALPIVAAQMSAGRTGSDVLVVAFFALLAVDSGLGAALGVRRITPQWAVARRLLALLTHELDAPAGPPRVGPAALELEGVAMSEDGNPVLADVSLAIDAGEHVALVGASGAGKSTLTAVLMGWAQPEVGNVWLDGEPLDPARAGALRAATVWVDPETAIWSGTISDNLGGDPEHRHDIAAVAGLASVVDRLGGIDGHVGESGRLLSGGEGQRVRLARAFCRPSPRLVVLDEAFRGLDETRRSQLLQESRRRWADSTLVWVTHHVEETADWDRVIVVDRGRIVDDGSPSELAGADGAYVHTVRAQQRVRETLAPGDAWASVRVTDGTLAERTTTGVGTVRVSPSEPPTDGTDHAVTPSVDRSSRTGSAGRAAPWLVVATIAVAAATYVYVLGWTGLSAAADGASRTWWAWFLVAALLTSVYGWGIGQSGIEIGTVLRERLLAGVLGADLDATRRSGAGELLGRVMELDSFEQLLLAGAAGALIGLAQVGGAAIAGSVAGVPIALVAAIVGWLAVVIGLGALVAQRRVRWSRARVELSGLLVERFRGHRTEQVYGPPPHAGEAGLAPYQTQSRSLDVTRALLLGVAAPAWLAAGIALAVSTADAATILAAVGITLLAWEGFTSTTLAADDLGTAAAAHRQFRHLLRPVTQLEGNAESNGSVEARDVTLTYPGAAQPAVRSVSLHIEPGEHLLLLGSSGAGKTTLASVLAGIRRPDTGTVTGVNRVLYVPQFGDNHTFQAPLAYNLLLGRRWPPEPEVWGPLFDTLDALGLADVVANMPRDVAQPVGECGWQLSHGERTRLHLARALLQEPDVLILDETLAGLDPTTTLAVIDLLRERVTTLVLITHP